MLAVSTRTEIFSRALQILYWFWGSDLKTNAKWVNGIQNSSMLHISLCIISQFYVLVPLAAGTNDDCE